MPEEERSFLGALLSGLSPFKKVHVNDNSVTVCLWIRQEAAAPALPLSLMPSEIREVCLHVNSLSA